ncbi:tyrosine-protein phosphatase 2-like [Physella acuta]|uniref:tyrosine-protein phosphatase 2-like n=1 Tax=Physella acuta TaxID=109671 RepID=UPI0027DAB85C|nr:tyrosine-protein phosphatase 2-like [Physella acuta]
MICKVLSNFCLPNDKDDNPPRQLTHFQYTAWPEDGSDPCMWSLVDFEHKVFFNTLETVTLVHSGTDTTRSSVFIALHDLIRQAKLNQAVDFVDTVSRLRQDMPNTVQTFEQYMFLHHAAQAGIACTGSYTHISAIFLKVHLMGKVVNGKSNFKKEFKNLFSLEIKFKGGVGDVIQNPQSKNRFLIVPEMYNNINDSSV